MTYYRSITKYNINDHWINYKKESDKLCEISKFLANKSKSPDVVSGFFCNFLKKLKDKGFQKICAKWSAAPDHEQLFVNYLNKLSILLENRCIN